MITAAVYQPKYCEKARRNRRMMTESEAAGQLPHSGICKCIGTQRKKNIYFIMIDWIFNLCLQCDFVNFSES